MRVTLKNLKNLAEKGIDIMNGERADMVKIDNLEVIVLECTGSQAAADELIASHTIGEIIGFITASFQPPKAAE